MHEAGGWARGTETVVGGEVPRRPRATWLADAAARRDDPTDLDGVDGTIAVDHRRSCRAGQLVLDGGLAWRGADAAVVAT